MDTNWCTYPTTILGKCKRKKSRTVFLLKTSLWKVLSRTIQTRPPKLTTNIQDHHRLQTEDSVTALFTTTSASGAIQHTFQRKINMLLEKGRSTLLVLKMESCITSAGPPVSVHVNSKIVYTQNLCSTSN